MKAIETEYSGYRFRSRLEARWAVFFDAIGIKWSYEPEGYHLGDAGNYLPDFWLPFSARESSVSGHENPGRFIEIKPTKPNATEILKASALHKETKHHVFFLCGTPGDHQVFMAMENRLVDWISEKDDDADMFMLWALFERHAEHGFVRQCGGAKRLVVFAVKEARSARFEHGDKPRVITKPVPSVGIVQRVLSAVDTKPLWTAPPLPRAERIAEKPKTEVPSKPLWVPPWARDKVSDL